MSEQTRTSFLSSLKERGYTNIPIFAAQAPCTHPHDATCYLYILPDPEEEDDIVGWHRFEGCKSCVTELGGIFFCGGMYFAMHMFEGEQELT